MTDFFSFDMFIFECLSTFQSLHWDTEVSRFTKITKHFLTFSDQHAGTKVSFFFRYLCCFKDVSKFRCGHQKVVRHDLWGTCKNMTVVLFTQDSTILKVLLSRANNSVLNIIKFHCPNRNWRNIRTCDVNQTAEPVCLNQWALSWTQTGPQPTQMHPGRTLHEAEERGKKRKKNPKHFAHLLHNNTQWSQNEMTSFTIFMAFCLLFYTIYNHLISFFQYKGGKKMLMYNKSLLLQT